jgi:phage protein D
MPDGRDILFASVSPGFRVEGAASPALGRDVRALEVEETLEGLARLEFSLAALGPRQGSAVETLLYLDGGVLDFGREVEVLLGPADAQASVFRGRVSALELAMDQGREPAVRVCAEDRLMDLRMTRRFATYENADLADLAQAIAGRHGLSAQVEAASPRQAMVQQWSQTDLAFLREQAARVAAELWLDGSVLHIAERTRRRDAAQPITLIQGNDLLSIALRADLAGQRNSVTVGGYDAAARDGIAEDAAGELATAEAAGRRTGPQVLQGAFAERTSFRLRDVPLDAAAARAWSRAAMLARARRFVTAEGVTMGTPALRAGTQLRLERVGAPFEGDGYHVTRALHRYDLEHGYRTFFTAERAGLGTGP